MNKLDRIGWTRRVHLGLDALPACIASLRLAKRRLRLITPATAGRDDANSVRFDHLAAAPAHALNRAHRKPRMNVSAQPPADENQDAAAARLFSRARLAVASLFEDARAGRALRIDHWSSMLDEISISIQRDASAALRTIRTFADAEILVAHSVAVCVLMTMLARRLGRNEAQIREAGMAGLLHDVGRSLLPEHLRNRSGSGTDDDFGRGNHLLRAGHDMLRRAGCVSPTVLDICLHHQEHCDATGYPDGLSVAELGIESRMLAICVAYEGITSRRPNGEALEPAHAILRLAEWTRNGRFDQTLFLAFVECIGIYPVGSLVRLSSGRIGLVTGQSESVPYSPHVKVFYSAADECLISTELVDLSRPGCGDAIVARESNSDWQFSFLDQLMANSRELHRPPLRTRC